MNCKETEQIIQAYLDGELDLVRSLEVEQHLKECPVCAQAHREKQSLRTALAGGSLYFNAPKGLETRVRSLLGQTSKVEPSADSGRRRWNWTWPTFFAPLAAAALVLFIGLPMLTRRSAEDNLVQEVVSAHLRSLMADTAHLTDVASSDQHTVKPWFAGKLPFSPPVIDLAAQGFPLVGGRLDYIGDHQAAALVYQRRKHLINLFLWPEQGDSKHELKTQQGYNVIHWNQGGMACWAVSDVNLGDLREFQGLLSGK
jgi:anti-sigma factor RsiW